MAPLINLLITIAIYALVIYLVIYAMKLIFPELPPRVIQIAYAILLLILALIIMDFAASGTLFPRVVLIRSP